MYRTNRQHRLILRALAPGIWGLAQLQINGHYAEIDSAPANYSMTYRFETCTYSLVRFRLLGDTSVQPTV
jgi:hypothetical protein